MNRDYAAAGDDRDEIYRQFFEGMQREYLRTLVCDEVIEEHRRQPLGQHSEPLERLLRYFRGAPQKNKYVIKRNDTSRTFKIAALSGERGTSLNTVGDSEYATLKEAYHEVFLRRLRDLQETDS